MKEKYDNPQISNYWKSKRNRLRYRNSMYRANKLNAIPLFADRSKIRDIYNNCPDGYVVDHIVPLRHKKVKGLHVHTNLQYLTEEEDIKKANKMLDF